MKIPFAFLKRLEIAAPVLSAVSNAVFDTARTSGAVLTVNDSSIVTSVLVDGVSVAFEVINATRLIARIPAHAAGTYNVVARGAGGDSAPISVESWSPTTDPNCTWFVERDYVGTDTWAARVGAAATLSGTVPDVALGAKFEGNGHFLGPNFSTLAPNSGGTLAAIVSPAVAPAEAVETYNNASIVSRVTSGPIDLWTASTGGVPHVAFSVYDSAGVYRRARKSDAGLLTGHHAVVAKYAQAVSVAISLNGSSFGDAGASEALTGHPHTYDAAIAIGCTYSSVRTYRGGVRALAVFNVAFTDSQLARFVAWGRATHGTPNGSAPQIERIDHDVIRPNAAFNVLVTGKNLGGANRSAYLISSSGVTACTVGSVSSAGTAVLITIPFLSVSDHYTLVYVTDDGATQLAHGLQIASPATVGTCVLWHNPSAIVHSGGNITSWPDSSGNGDANRVATPVSDAVPYSSALPEYSMAAAVGPFRDATFTARRLAHAGAWTGTPPSSWSLGKVGRAEATGGARYFTFESVSQYNSLLSSVGNPRAYAKDATYSFNHSVPAGDVAQWRQVDFVSGSNAARTWLGRTKPETGTVEINPISLGTAGLKLGSYPGSSNTFGVEQLVEVYAHAPPLTPAQTRTVRESAYSAFFSRVTLAHRSLSTWFRDFTPTAWAGSASAGSSGTRTMRAASGYSYPGSGTSINGRTIASYNGSTHATQIDTTPKTVLDVLGDGANYSFGILVKATPASDDPTLHLNRAILGSAGAAWCGLYGRSSGSVGWRHYVSADTNRVDATIDWSIWNYIQVVKLAGSGIRMRINGGPWTAYTSVGNFADTSQAFRFGVNSPGAGGTCMQMEKAEFWAEKDVALTAEVFDRKLAEMRTRYALALR